jgi:hypothetical protein
VPFSGVEALLIGWLKTQLPSVRFLTDTPADLATAGPVVQVARIGGPSSDDDPSFQSPTVSVDCFAADRISATLLAQQIDDALRKALPGVTTGGATVTKVATISGAAWRPWDDLKVRRVGATYVLYLKSS